MAAYKFNQTGRCVDACARVSGRISLHLSPLALYACSYVVGKAFPSLTFPSPTRNSSYIVGKASLRKPIVLLRQGMLGGSPELSITGLDGTTGPTLKASIYISKKFSGQNNAARGRRLQQSDSRGRRLQQSDSRANDPRFGKEPVPFVCTEPSAGCKFKLPREHFGQTNDPDDGVGQRPSAPEGSSLIFWLPLPSPSPSPSPLLSPFLSYLLPPAPTSPQSSTAKTMNVGSGTGSSPIRLRS